MDLSILRHHGCCKCHAWADNGLHNRKFSDDKLQLLIDPPFLHHPRPGIEQESEWKFLLHVHAQMGGDNLCPVVQMEEIKPHNGQLAGRQFVRYSLRDFRGGNSRLRGVEAAGT